MNFKRILHCSTVLVGGACVSALTSTASLADSSFSDLEDLPGGLLSSAAFDVSADGSVAVGYGTSASGYEAFRWTEAGGMVGLGDLPGGAFWSAAFGVSADGSVIAGYGTSNSGFEAFRWTEAGGMVGLGDLAGGFFYSNASDISADGSVIVGYSNSTSGREAFRWTEAGDMVGLGDLPGGSFESNASGVSADGSVVVGYGTSASGREAFRWTEAGGMVGLGDLPGGFFFFSEVFGVNADGSVIVGSSTSTSGVEAFRWTEASGMVGLGDLPGGSYYSYARDVSADGSVIVGGGISASGNEAIRWLEGAGPGSGLHSVADLLTNEGVNLGAWRLIEATGVSDDGKVIVGLGTDPDGYTKAWRAVVDVGFVSVEDFFGSLGPMAASAQSAQAVASDNLALLMNVARFYNMRKPGGESRRAAIPWSSLRFASDSLEGLSLSEASDVRKTNLWAAGRMAGYDSGTTESDDLVGSFGISVPLSESLRMGTGYQIGESEVLVSGTQGNQSERTAWGLNGYLAYEPADHPLRVYVGATTMKLEDDLERNYLNGVDPVRSSGSRDGRAVGGSVIAGWSAPAGATGAIMPFASYEATRITLDGYTETGGPFPAAFDKVAYTSEVSRLGAELSAPLRSTMSVWGSLAWAHRFDKSQPGISGYIAGLSSGFAFGSTPTNRNWTEVKGGFNASIRKSSSLHMSFSAAMDGEEDTRYGGTIGISIRR